MKLINYTMPLIKSSSGLSEDDLAEYNFSITDEFLNFIGLDASNPLSILGREVSMFTPKDTYADSKEGKPSFSLNPFKFSESTIIRNEQTGNKPEDNNTTAPVVVAAQVYNPKIKKTLNPAKPEVLIYHSHTTETYSPYGTYIEDESKNMVSVGEVIAKDLENNYGIATIHDKTIHNIELQALAYSKSAKTLDMYLNKYKDFKLIIDLHRDSVTDRAAIATKLNNNNLARFMFVIGVGNPNKEKNIAVSKELSKISQSLFPGLIRGGNSGDYGLFYHKKGTKFNQQKSGNAVLIELGSQTNTLDEAKASGLYLSRIIAEYINEKK